ncbi:EP23 [Euproctis pseudoconspersa nucleopolyhedrovirus]|uniref:EP23 n=1 Tax=Euproctis pseudoconspersa nucleopolyhedrovirus TaxID=307467 RepID=C3TWR7_9ABAC|nr:EP23 [Euproctis pseudoconspersa nucleopolyhedrovirus]ACO53459.1 EP23 [Euproctis pseudoconspersa nucleopolyhedrovirus]QUJ09203.1 EP23 protein [Gynaephora ruoergensis nucleopolyhedrovirus]
MNINLYYPNDRDNDLITFTIPSGLVSIDVFAYNFKVSAVNDFGESKKITTKLVSGYETHYRKINMNIFTTLNEKIDGYVVSCVRLPFVATNFITLPNFSKPLSIVVVQIRDETQVWHVFGVRKHFEFKVFQRVQGILVCQNGNERFYKKELIAVCGNVPATFVTAMGRHTNNTLDLNMIIVTHPHIRHNKENVTLIIK